MITERMNPVRVRITGAVRHILLPRETFLQLQRDPTFQRGAGLLLRQNIGTSSRIESV